jgi:hypothetical protein
MWWIVGILLILLICSGGRQGVGCPGPRGPDDLPEEYWTNKRRFK